jgi:hypothetical protein
MSGSYDIIKQGVPLAGSRKWNFDVTIQRKSAQVIRTNNCFAIMFTNVGDTIAFLNGIIVYPGVVGTSLGDSRALSGHVLDMFVGLLNVAFQAPVNANPALEIIQLFYEDEDAYPNLK